MKHPVLLQFGKRSNKLNSTSHVNSLFLFCGKAVVGYAPSDWCGVTCWVMASENIVVYIEKKYWDFPGAQETLRRVCRLYMFP